MKSEAWEKQKSVRQITTAASKTTWVNIGALECSLLNPPASAIDSKSKQALDLISLALAEPASSLLGSRDEHSFFRHKCWIDWLSIIHLHKLLRNVRPKALVAAYRSSSCRYARSFVLILCHLINHNRLLIVNNQRRKPLALELNVSITPNVSSCGVEDYKRLIAPHVCILVAKGSQKAKIHAKKGALWQNRNT